MIKLMTPHGTKHQLIKKIMLLKILKQEGHLKPPAGYTLSTEEFLEKIGLKKSSLDTYVSDPDKTTHS